MHIFAVSCVKGGQILPASNENKRDSIAYSLPVWLVAKLKGEYGEERAQAIFESLLVATKPVSVWTDLESKEEIQVLLEASDSPFVCFGLVKEQGHFAGHDLFSEGLLLSKTSLVSWLLPLLIYKVMSRF